MGQLLVKQSKQKQISESVLPESDIVTIDYVKETLQAYVLQYCHQNKQTILSQILLGR